MTTDLELLEAAARDEALASRVAHILGDSSAAACALREAKAFRDAGVPAAVILCGATWIVARAAASLANEGDANVR